MPAGTTIRCPRCHADAGLTRQTLHRLADGPIEVVCKACGIRYSVRAVTRYLTGTLGEGNAA